MRSAGWCCRGSRAGASQARPPGRRSPWPGRTGSVGFCTRSVRSTMRPRTRSAGSSASRCSGSVISNSHLATGCAATTGGSTSRRERPLRAATPLLAVLGRAVDWRSGAGRAVALVRGVMVAGRSVSTRSEAFSGPARVGRDSLHGRCAGLKAGAELFDAFGVVAHPVAGPVARGHGAGVEESVEDRGGPGGVVEDLAPGGDAAVGGEDDGAVLVPPRDNLEEMTRGLDRQGEVAELVDDQQLRPVPEAHRR